ncbi:hypothetical protein NPIL_263181, partial [Nephila pilipes]
IASENPPSVRKKRREAKHGRVPRARGTPTLPAGSDYVTYSKEVITLEKKIKPGVETPGDDRKRSSEF